MADDPGPSPHDRRSGDYQAARIGASTALTAVVVVLLVADVVTTGYDVDPVVLVSLLGAIATLLGIEAVDVIRGR
jgi:hypothetical protein